MKCFEVKKNTGITLMELIVTMAIIGLVMTPVSIILYNGYKSYFEEQDKMIALSKANEAIELIINDLRKFEEYSTTVDNISGQKLVINQSLIYSYDQSELSIKKNGMNIFASTPDVKVQGFRVNEKSEENYDAKLIEVFIDLKYKKSDIISLSNTYRRRY